MKNNNNYNENIRLNAQAIRDKISGLVLNEIELSKEFEQFIKEKYSKKNINSNATNEKNEHRKSKKLLNNKNKENVYRSNNFISEKSIIEVSVDNFTDAFVQKDTKNTWSENNLDALFQEKIEFLKLKTAENENDNFADKERKYLEIIERLFTSIKEIQDDKELKESTNNNSNKVKNSLNNSQIEKNNRGQ